MDDSLKHQLALTLTPKIGSVLAKRLVAYCGSAEAVFKESVRVLEKIPGIGRANALAISRPNKTIFERADEEIAFIEQNNIAPLFFTSTDYPKRLTHCDDGPALLFSKGKMDLNSARFVSIVGTRNATEYGRQLCEQLVKDLKSENVVIVSGLAYGIDICAHKAALKNQLPTICTLAHGLDRIYPSTHQNTAEKMLENGGWLTEFTSKTTPSRENFPSRNRIVAGMADAVVVIESKKSGGSLITANIANSYNRDVFAFPGRIGDSCSEGCNDIIKQNKAALIQSAKDLKYIMGWETEQKTATPQQASLFVELSPLEEKIVSCLQKQLPMGIDDLCYSTKLSMSQVSTLLLTLEFSGVIKSLPGKMYALQ